MSNHDNVLFLTGKSNSNSLFRQISDNFERVDYVCPICTDLFDDLKIAIAAHAECKAKLLAITNSSTAAEYRKQWEETSDAQLEVELVQNTIETHWLRHHRSSGFTGSKSAVA